MSVKIDSTTDTAAQVQEASGAKAPEAPKTVEPSKEVDPAAPPAKAEGETTEESATAEEHEEEEVDTPEGQPKKKPGGFQKKIDKLTKRTTELAQEAEFWKQQAMKGQQAPAPKPAEPTVAPTPVATGKPDPAKFDTHAEFVEALADWKVDQKLQAREQVEKTTRAKTEAEARNATWQEKLVRGREKYDDFDDAMTANVPVSPPMAEVLMNSDVGADLAYYLGKNPAEAVRIAKLSPIAAARALGMIEARLETVPTAAAPASAAASAKPRPPTPVAGGKADITTKSPDQMSFQEYKAWRNKQSISQRG